MTFQHGDNWRCDETCDHPTRSPDSPDPRGNAAIEAIERIQRAIHMKDREASDGTLVTAAVIVQEAREAIREFHNAPPRSPDSPDPTVRQLAVEIANLAHKGWWTPDNAEFLFTAIEERAKDIIEAEPPPRSPDSVRTPDLDVERLGLAIAKHWHDHPTSGYSFGHCASEVAVEYARLAALHPASPPQPDIITDEQAEAWLQANDLTAVTHQHPAGDCDECAAASPPQEKP
jgi:hypothetical protein